MKGYIGVKQVLAMAMTLGAYNEYRGWDLPEDEDGSKEGYLVEYQNGGEANHPKHSGYISWCPKDVFEASNRPCGGLTFGHALEALQNGKRVARVGWNGKGMWLIHVPGSESIEVAEGSPYHKAGFETVSIGGHIDMFTAQGIMQPGWLASQNDMLANDWTIIEDSEDSDPA